MYVLCFQSISELNSNCVTRNTGPRLVGVTVYPSPARLITGGGKKEGRNEARDHPCLALRGAAGSAYEREGAGGIADAWTGRDGMV